jgi:predicted AlkP superfamily phosphohydrolase/phosphomutase
VLDRPDKIQHLFWRYVDRGLFEQDPSERDHQIRRLCLDYYRELDAALERIVRLAGPTTNVIMTSDHGFGATTEVVYINEWLASRGYLAWTDHAQIDASTKPTLERIKDHIVGINWSHTQAYAVTPSSNAVYIKRANRSGSGVPADEYRDFCLRLRQELLDYRHPLDGG